MPSSPVRVNVGCGATPTPGWLNLDNSWTIRAVQNRPLGMAFGAAGLLRGKQDYINAIRQYDIQWADATTHLPLEDGSAEVVYTSHMVEHLTRVEARRFFAEALRVLSAGGILRVAVPDIDYHVDLYRKHGDANEFVAGLHMSGERPESFFGRVRQTLVGERQHHWMYNGQTLSRELEVAGFAKVGVQPAGSTWIKFPGDLDLAERAPESVFVEALKAS